MVPNRGDWISLESFDHCKRLIHTNEDEYLLMDNICTHKNVILARGSGKSERISCPFHKWTFDSMNGELIHSPDMKICNNHNLFSKKLKNLNGILIDAENDIYIKLKSKLKDKIPDLSKYKLNRIEKFDIKADWRIFIEVYLDLYHIKYIHNGLSNMINQDDLNIEIGDLYSIQNQGCKIDFNKKYLENISNLQNIKPFNLGIKWILVYPNIMIEIYPGDNVVISTVNNDEDGKCTNIVEFYNNPDIEKISPELSKIHEELYLETAREDLEMIESVQIGRNFISKHNDSFPENINHPTLEFAISNFYEYLGK